MGFDMKTLHFYIPWYFMSCLQVACCPSKSAPTVNVFNDIEEAEEAEDIDDIKAMESFSNLQIHQPSVAIAFVVAVILCLGTFFICWFLRSCGYLCADVQLPSAGGIASRTGAEFSRRRSSVMGFLRQRDAVRNDRNEMTEERGNRFNPSSSGAVRLAILERRERDRVRQDQQDQRDQRDQRDHRDQAELREILEDRDERITPTDQFENKPKGLLY